MKRPSTLVASLLALLLGFAAVAVGCSSASPAAEEAFSADVGCDPRMDSALRAWAERGVAASVVDLGVDRECVGAYGLADPETGRKNTVDTVYSIGSITKAVTAAAVFRLVDEGVLSLDDTAGTHVSGLSGPAADSTLRDLLLHTSGITGEHGVDHVPLSQDEAIESISGLGVSFEPGAGYQYANANYTLLALMIEAVTDEGYRRFMAEQIMLDRNGQPLGGFWDGAPAPDGPRALGHFAGGGPSLQRGEATGPHWAMDGNGLIAMTPLAMAEWTYALFTEQLLSPEATSNLLSTSTLLAGDKELPGWSELDRSVVGEPVIVTSGGGGSIGHVMDVVWFPESSRVIVIAENAADYDVPGFVGDIASALIAGTGIPEPPPIPVADEEALRNGPGRYRLGGDGELVITERDGGLLVTTIGGDAVRALYPVPGGLAGLVERHEQHAADFIAGATPEGRRERDRLERLHGALTSSRIIATTFDGELATVATLSFDGHETVLTIGLNPNGGTEFYGYDEWPSQWLVSIGDGMFAPYLPNPENPPVRLRPTDAGVEIQGPDGEQIASEVEST